MLEPAFEVVGMGGLSQQDEEVSAEPRGTRHRGRSAPLKDVGYVGEPNGSHEVVGRCVGHAVEVQTRPGGWCPGVCAAGAGLTHELAAEVALEETMTKATVVDKELMKSSQVRAGIFMGGDLIDVREGGLRTRGEGLSERFVRFEKVQFQEKAPACL